MYESSFIKYSHLIQSISTRKSKISRKVRDIGEEILDVYHGEMYYPMHQKAQDAVLQMARKIVTGEAKLTETNGELYNKSQPQILRQLAAEKLYPQFLHANLQLTPNEIITCPYSSLVMLETALMTLAKPKGIILCPQGFYKSTALHVEKFNLELRNIEVDLEDDARFTPQTLRQAIQKYRHRLCGILFTMPGNPLVTEYSVQELQAIGKVLVEENVKVIVDATFTGIYNHHLPLAAVQVEHLGQKYTLHQQTLTITGVSKGHHASGPIKIGVATSGNKQWLAAIKNKLVLSFQRETTALARTLLEHTPLSYLLDNELKMKAIQRRVKQYVLDLNKQFGEGVIKYYGSAKYGPFILLTFRKELLKMAGIKDSWQLADMLLASVGLNCVSGMRMGLKEPCVRINVNAPRIGNNKEPKLITMLFAKLKRFIFEIQEERLTYTAALERIGSHTPISVDDYFKGKDIERVSSSPKRIKPFIIKEFQTPLS